MKSNSFKSGIEGCVATITLSRPERLNALTFEIYRELTDWFAEVRHDKDIRAVILRGDGESFCSGGDVKEIIGPLLQKDLQGTLEFTRMTGRLVGNIIKCGKPVVAELKGVVAGAGAVIALAADLRVSSEDCRIAFLFSRVGLAGCDMGAAYLLPRIVGLGRALEILYSGDFITSTEAYRMGLVNRVVTGSDLEATTNAVAKQLGEMPGFGVSMTKDLVFRELNMDFVAAIEAEAEAQAICMHHPDFQEGYQAFLERRAPRFNQ